MSEKKDDDQYSEEETKRRAEDALRGAFKTPPQPLNEKKPAKKTGSRDSP